MRKVLVVIGTYSEAILMAPLMHRLREAPALQSVIYLAAPERQRLQETLAMLGVRPGEGGGLMEREPHLSIGRDLDGVIRKHRPDYVFMHGDTSAAIESSCLHTGCRDAGLRLHELRYPSRQDDANSHQCEVTATYFFVASDAVRTSLLKQGIAAEDIYLIGSMAVEAMQMALRRIGSDGALKAGLAASFPFLEKGRRLVLVIGHRRENQGGGLENVCRALKRLAMRLDVHVAYPAPVDPTVRGLVEEVFAGHPNITLVEPQDYLHMAYLMQVAYLILADSGATPEEVLALDKPVLVMRSVTEGAEAIDAGTVKLVGTDTERILRECTLFLDDASYYRAFSRHRIPHGAGLDSRRIVGMLRR